MRNDGWRYYNQALMPDVPPHIQANLSAMNEKDFWKSGGGIPLFARWTSHWDCNYETNWWYVIKDTPFDISTLKAKRRYEINKGNKHFSVREINPKEYKSEIYEIQLKAYAEYPEKYRPHIDRERLFEEIENWTFYKVYGAFHLESKEMLGYAVLNRKGNYIYYAVHKVVPQYESLSINAAIVNRILVDHNDFLASDGYICDGARNILHETGFQDYLEKYFGFRKAYCKLHIQYRPLVKLAVKLLYPFRKCLYKMDGNSFVHKVNGILKMEELVRS
jgi:hypothetical protein